jgi:hypothetical protein
MGSGGIHKVGGSKHLFLGKTLSLNRNKTLNLSTLNKQKIGFEKVRSSIIK